jgi:hypothetical protein
MRCTAADSKVEPALPRALHLLPVYELSPKIHRAKSPRGQGVLKELAAMLSILQVSHEALLATPGNA